MRFLRPAKKTTAKAAVLYVLVILALAAAPAAAAGAGEADAEDAGVGHVFVRAAVEEGYEADITAVLIPASGGGDAHEYCLNAENCYGISDDIQEGTYVCVPFITDPAKDGDVYVEYGGGEEEVSREGDACFLVVAGSAGFVMDYIWLSGFRDENGKCLKGPVSRQTAEEAFLITIARQGEQAGDVGSAADTGPEEMEDAAGPGQGQEAPVPETGETPAEGQGAKGTLPALAVAAAAAACIVLIAAGAYHIWKRR